MGEIIEQIGDSSYPVGLVIRFGIMGVTSVPMGANVMAALGEASHGPAMQVMPLTSSYETNQYYKSGPLARAGQVAFAQGLPAGYFIRVMGPGFAAAKKYLHDGLLITEGYDLYGDGSEGPYDLNAKCYSQNVANEVKIGLINYTIVYSPVSLSSGEVYLDQENGTLTFFTDEGPLADDVIETTLEHYGNLGVFNSPNTGISGNSGFAVIANGTFHGHDVEEFTGDGSAGPYYLQYHDLIEDEDNKVWVADSEKTVVYSPGDLGVGKVYINIATGGLTFFAGEEPQSTDAIMVNILYHTKKLTIHDGATAHPAIDNLEDLAAIQAALIYHPTMSFTPDALATHLPANGSYQLDGGLNGAALTSQDWADAMDILFAYIEMANVNIATCVFCSNTVDEGEYDLIPVMAGKLNEAKRNFYPFMGFIGLNVNELPERAMGIASNFANYEMSVVINPWDQSTPYRLDAAVARAAQEATAPLGTSCMRRVAAMSLQGLSEDGLLNTYRRETVKALHNGRLDVLVKTDAGIFTFYGRNTAKEEQYRECVDVRTINYMTWVIKYITDKYYGAKNTPDVRATLREDIANVLDRLVADQVMDAYTLKVTSGRPEGNKGLVRVKLEAENVGHIKQFIVDYYNGIIATASVE
ncbi:MAG: hypothetical protein ACYDG4_15095 [Desulfuromonadaceae bacterium]